MFHRLHNHEEYSAVDAAEYTYYSRPAISIMFGNGVVGSELYEEPTSGDLYVKASVGAYAHERSVTHSYYYNVETGKKYTEAEAPAGLQFIQPENSAVDLIKFEGQRKTPKVTHGHVGPYSTTFTTGGDNYLYFSHGDEKRRLNQIMLDSFKFYPQYGIIVGYDVTHVCVIDVSSCFSNVRGRVTFHFQPDICVIC